MKWYIEFPIVWAVVFFVYFISFTSGNDPIALRIVLSLVIGTLLSAGGYAGYYGVKKQQKMQKAGEEEKAIMQKKARKTNRALIWIIIALVLFCVCMIGLVMII